MAEEKKPPARDLLVRIQEAALREAGGPLPIALAEEIKAKLQSLRLTPQDASRVIREVARRFRRAEVDPHESVGIVAAQSIGEPGTGMPLRTCHNAGVADINATPGPPRLTELVYARRAPSTP